MRHPLEIKFGLTKDELLDAMGKRFRALVTLEGAVAEVHLGKQIGELKQKDIITRYEEHDKDGIPDFSIWTPYNSNNELLIECKNVRNSDEAFRTKGRITAYKVETQKTRSSTKDKSSRFYGIEQFDILAVCLGKKTDNWKEFLFISSTNMERHPSYPNKLAIFHKVPLPHEDVKPPWFKSLEELLKSLP